MTTCQALETEPSTSTFSSKPEPVDSQRVKTPVELLRQEQVGLAVGVEVERAEEGPAGVDVGLRGISGLPIAAGFRREPAEAIDSQLSMGGLVLWIEPRDPAQQTQAVEAMREPGATDVNDVSSRPFAESLDRGPWPAFPSPRLTPALRLTALDRLRKILE